MSKLGPMMAMMGMGTGQAAQPQAEVAKPQEEKPKEEEKKEKTHYDIELSKFDPTKKVGLIKVVR